MLIIICGLPGTGKSTLARELAKALNALHISSDSVRLKLLKERTYSEREKWMIYERMLGEAGERIKKGEDVILDATFYQQALRKKVAEMAEAEKTNCILVECCLAEEKIKERMEGRKKTKDESEATFEIYKKVKREYEPVRENHLVVSTDEPLKKQVEKVLEYIKKFGGYENLIDTHISYVYVMDGIVYKIKKPVKFSFLDFSTRELREFYCREEVRLNRRLCPDVYLGVVNAERHFGGHVFGEGSEPAVKMKKMPMERQMDRLLEKEMVNFEHIKKIARMVADFHKNIAIIKDRKYGKPALIRRQVEDIMAHRQTIDSATGMGKTIDYVIEQCAEFHEKNLNIFKKRQEDGFIRECHGDLHSANVIIADRIYIFDCIEFNPDFRNIDVASEIAFMAMDLDAYERNDLADLFISEYVKASGDIGALVLLDYYKCYRADVRAKVAAIEYAQKPNENSKNRMIKYVGLMEEYAKKLNA